MNNNIVVNYFTVVSCVIKIKYKILLFNYSSVLPIANNYLIFTNMF